MSVFQMDLYGELLIRIVFFICLGLFIVKPLKPSRMERKLYFCIFAAFIWAKWFILSSSNPSHEEVKDFFLIGGIFANVVGYFSLFVFLQSIFNIKRHFKDVPARPESWRVENSG